MLGQQRGDHLFDMFFGSGTREFIDHFAIDIKPDIGNSLHALLCGKTLCLIHIDDSEFHGVGVFIGNFAQYGFELFAGRAPCRRKIHDVQRAGRGDEGFEIICSQVVGGWGSARGFFRARNNESQREGEENQMDFHTVKIGGIVGLSRGFSCKRKFDYFGGCILRVTK